MLIVVVVVAEIDHHTLSVPVVVLVAVTLGRLWLA